MNRRYIVAATFLGIAACVTSAPEAPESTAKAGKSVTNSNSTARETGGVGVVDVPEVPKAASLRAENEIVCRIERETGTHMRVRVCRTRTQIDATRKRTQKMLRDMDMGSH